jgi:hypothetical protein
MSVYCLLSTPPPSGLLYLHRLKHDTQQRNRGQGTGDQDRDRRDQDGGGAGGAGGAGQGGQGRTMLSEEADSGQLSQLSLSHSMLCLDQV